MEAPNISQVTQREHAAWRSKWIHRAKTMDDLCPICTNPINWTELRTRDGLQSISWWHQNGPPLPPLCTVGLCVTPHPDQPGKAVVCSNWVIY